MTFFATRLTLVSLLALSSLDGWALEFKPGLYELVKGDDNICEDGPLQIKEDQLTLGAKLVFLKYQSPSFSFLNDEKDCQYSIKNIHDKKNYEQQLTIKCDKAPLYKRSIKFHYEGSDKLLMVISDKGKTYPCELKLKK